MLNKVFIWTIYKKSFPFGKLSLVYVLFCLCLHHFLLSSVSRFGQPLLMHWHVLPGILYILFTSIYH